MKRALFVAAAICALSTTAQAHFADGYLAECSAVTSTSCTEPTYTGYARQPTYFNVPNSGVMVSGQQFNFGSGSVGLVTAGRAVYDAPTGGHLLFVIPVSYTAPYSADRGDTAAIQFTLTGNTGSTGDTIAATFAAGATLGTNPDGTLVTAGYPLTIGRGILQAYATPVSPFYIQTTKTTGFSYTVPNGNLDVQINGAGTLATGTLALPVVPLDGQVLRLSCAVTVTALTVTAPAGYAFTGTAPTTCGPNASHEFLFFAASHTVVNLF